MSHKTRRRNNLVRKAVMNGLPARHANNSNVTRKIVEKAVWRSVVLCI